MSFQAMLSKLKQDVSAPLPSSSAPSSSAAAAVVEPPKKRQKTVNDNGDHDTSTKSDHFPFPKNKVKTIYLACPPNVQTGGPEAMHQLCHKINSLSNDVSASGSANTNEGSGTGIRLSAYMLFLKEQPHQEDQYIQHVTNAKILYAYESMYDNLKTASSFPMMMEEDGDDLYNDSLIIWPECWTHLIDSFQPENYTDNVSNNNSNKRYQTAIWWLSVNNNNSKFKEWDREDILHLYQSEYAKCYLVDNILKNKPKSTNNDSSTNSSTNSSPVSYHNILPMTEFIPNRDDNNNNNNNSNNTSSKTRNLQIVYNPFKGVHYTDSIIRRSDTKFKFTPIGSTQKRISPSDVTKLLNAAKVYIDFGPHPGMDRLPREAALAGCIVITNKEGAAYYHEDVPLPKEYKVEKFDVDHIHRLLSSSIDQYDDKRKEFDSYRDWIHVQEGRMDICVKDFLKQISVDRKG